MWNHHSQNTAQQQQQISSTQITPNGCHISCKRINQSSYASRLICSVSISLSLIRCGLRQTMRMNRISWRVSLKSKAIYKNWHKSSLWQSHSMRKYRNSVLSIQIDFSSSSSSLSAASIYFSEEWASVKRVWRRRFLGNSFRETVANQDRNMNNTEKSDDMACAAESFKSTSSSFLYFLSFTAI